MREYEEYERAEEFKAMGDYAAECLKAILDSQSAENVGELARYVYKYTECGALTCFHLINMLCRSDKVKLHIKRIGE